MQSVIANLIEKLKSNDDNSIDEAIVLFADIFLIHNARLHEDLKKELLPEPYLSLQLNEDEQKEAVNALSDILISNPSNKLMPIIWILSKVPARIGLVALLNIVENCSDQIDDHSYFQVSNAFGSQLCFVEKPGSYDYIKAALKAKSPIPFYKQRLNSTNPEIAESARESIESWKAEFDLTE